MCMCDGKHLEWKDFVVHFCTACATTASRRRETLVPLFLLSTPHAEQSTVSFNLIYTAHLNWQRTHTLSAHSKACTHAQWAQRVCFGIRQSNKNVTEHNSNLCHPAMKRRLLLKLIISIYSMLHSSPLFLLSLKTKCGGNYLRQGQELTHTLTDTFLMLNPQNIQAVKANTIKCIYIHYVLYVCM